MTGCFDEEYMARLDPLMDRFSDEELDRLSEGSGPRLYVLLDDDGLPKSGIIYDPDTGRKEKFRFPIAPGVA